MQTEPLTAQHLARSVVAVPPLARNTDLTPNPEANQSLIHHLEAGGVRIFLYGGNANFYNVAPSEYAALLDMLQEIVSPESRVIPSAGPAHGTLMDQAAILAQTDFPETMVLPAAFAFTPDGIATSIRHFAERSGRRVVLYLKNDGYLEVDHVRRLVDDGVVSIIKYAIVRENPANDEFLARLVDAVEPSIIMSGMGEQPAIVHHRDFGLGGFTSGCVCVAPRLSTRLLEALNSMDDDEAELLRAMFEPLEDLRNEISPIRVLHDAVTLAGIADMGPILPSLSNLAPEQLERVRPAALALLDKNRPG